MARTLLVGGSAGRTHLVEIYVVSDTGKILNEPCPGDEWDVKRVDLVVAVVRDSLHKAGVKDLTREEVGEPVGYDLSHNLLTELIVNSDTLGRRDLDALDWGLDG